MTKLGKLKIGDAFLHEKEAYLAISLTPDPFDVYCLNLETRSIDQLEEALEVERIPWKLTVANKEKRGKQLEVL